MKRFAALTAATAALAPSYALAGAGNFPFVQNMSQLMQDVTGPLGAIAIAIACALIGVVIMARGGGAAVASGVTFVLGAGVVAWAATSPTTFGMAAGGILPLAGL
jgi:hypothetical protein